MPADPRPPPAPFRRAPRTEWQCGDCLHSLQEPPGRPWRCPVCLSLKLVRVEPVLGEDAPQANR
jgi:hypothetical protein